MGADYDIAKVKARSSREVHECHDKLVESCRYEHGHGGYSGTFAESPGVTFVDREFVSFQEAEEYIMKNAQKWENSLAVRIRDTDTWVIGGLFSC